MFKTITEGRARLKVSFGKICKKLDVFYNPVMKFNRDVSVLVLSCIPNKNMQIGLPLAGSGVRGVRFILELNKDKIKETWFNDNKSFENIKENLKLNNIKNRIKIFNKDANLFLIESLGFDYIDVDPFGSPNPFLDNAVKRIGRNGILAVTATDTSALSGTFPKVCLRKYWAVPLRNYLMHEVGLRILIRKMQLIAGQFDKALLPIFSYSKDHYLRVFFRCEKAKKKVDEIFKSHGYFNNAGPLWLGKLWDLNLVNKMVKNNRIEENKKILKIIKDESKLNTVGFYDIHQIVKKHKIKQIPKKEDLIKKIKKLKYKASETHFSPESIRSDISEEKLIKLLK